MKPAVTPGFILLFCLSRTVRERINEPVAKDIAGCPSAAAVVCRDTDRGRGPPAVFAVYEFHELPAHAPRYDPQRDRLQELPAPVRVGGFLGGARPYDRLPDCRAQSRDAAG